MKKSNFINIKLIIIVGIMFLAMILSIPFINAVPPTPFQTFTSGYKILIPQDNVLKIGEPYEFNFHIYNISDGTPVISGISCFFHLFNSTGSYIVSLTENIPGDDFDYSFDIDEGNFSNVERIYYDIQCNSSSLGGFSSSIIEINYLGKMLDTSESMLYIGFLGILILVFFLNFYGMQFLPARNMRDEDGKIMSVTYLKYFRNVLWMTGYFLFVGIMYISSNIAFSFLEEQLVAKTLFMIFQVSIALSPVVIIVWLIWIIASMFHDREFQNMLNRGIFPQGKL